MMLFTVGTSIQAYDDCDDDSDDSKQVYYLDYTTQIE